MLCDGNQDKRYKWRGIHGSLKASVPNKSSKEAVRERGCHNLKMKTSHVRRKLIGRSRDEAESAAAASFLGTGSLLGCPVFSLLLLLFRCQLLPVGSLSVCIFLSQGIIGQKTSNKIMFYSKSRESVPEKNGFLCTFTKPWRVWLEERKVDLHVSLRAHSCWLSGTLNWSIGLFLSAMIVCVWYLRDK